MFSQSRKHYLPHIELARLINEALILNTQVKIHMEKILNFNLDLFEVYHPGYTRLFKCLGIC